MARDEKYADLMSAMEALLFVSDEPVGIWTLAAMLGVDEPVAAEAMAALKAEYEEENRGMQLREVIGGWRFFSHPAHHELIERFVLSWDTRKLSQAALEALAVIAYHQPVTRAGVNAIRGVNSEGVVSSLVEKGLVKEVGREKSGTAILYGTTRSFLEKFGLKDVSELPPLEDFAPDEASKEFIRERLSGNVRGPQSAEEALEQLEDGEEAPALGTDVLVRDEGGRIVVEEVDAGDDERTDDPQAMAQVLGEALTEKVAFGMPTVAAGSWPAGLEDDEPEDIQEIES